MLDLADPLPSVKGQQGTGADGDPLRQASVGQEIVQDLSIRVAESMLGWSSPSHRSASPSKVGL
jgi:hypothetical protein